MIPTLADVSERTAAQQPSWQDPGEIAVVREILARRPSLVDPDDVLSLRGALARVAAGDALVVQAGDCAEDLADVSPVDVQRKTGLLDLVAGRLAMTAHKPVVRIGRIAGQYCKPRSRPTETVDGVELPAFRGQLVNGPDPDPVSRRPDPRRLLAGHRAARTVLGHLGWTRTAPVPFEAPIWSSHEALLLDYEVPQVFGGPHGPLLGSTHQPWIGDRTRRVDGPHVELLSTVVNPVACKVGPTMTPDELVELCGRLDPHRVPGRLTLIARMGADHAAERLSPLVPAVRAAGHPVIWLCDPMHGNTTVTSRGVKTRYVESMAREIGTFQHVVREGGGVDGGLHVETTPDAVRECLSTGDDEARIGLEDYTTLCDPRLNPGQALHLASAWAA